ncbi:hypothetical protein [Fodinicola feengrottensis]
MRRRDLLALAGASTLAGSLASAANTASSFLTELLIPFPLAPSSPTERAVPPDQLLRLSVRVRNQYQACRYDAAAGTLAELVPALQAAVTVSSGDFKSRLQSAISDAYHVIAGILLKVGNEGPAAVAADRSMNAARDSEIPVTIGASARIVSHALMGSGGARQASTYVKRFAEGFQAHLDPDDESSLSVYGSLLLRGAVAAARGSDRDTTLELVGEAERTATMLGHDGNHAWTAFGPTNVQLHRINLAVTLGDAGSAIAIAREVDDASIELVERRATFYLDVAAGFTQWGKHEPAYLAIRHAEAIAPEELTNRSSVHGLVHQLATASPPSLQPRVRELAARIGAAE